MYLIALTGFLFIGIIDFNVFLKASFGVTMLLNQPLLTLWFIGMILFFYLITPLFLLGYHAVKMFVWAALIVTALLILHKNLNRIDFRLIQYLPCYVLGLAYGRSRFLNNLFKQTKVRLCCGLLVAFFFILLPISSNSALGIAVVIAIILLSLPIWIAAGYTISLHLNPNLFEWLSYPSFALYLLHRITYHFAVMIYQPVGFLESIFYLVVVVLPISIVISYGFQRLYDFSTESYI